MFHSSEPVSADSFSIIVVYSVLFTLEEFLCQAKLNQAISNLYLTPIKKMLLLIKKEWVLLGGTLNWEPEGQNSSFNSAATCKYVLCLPEREAICLPSIEGRTTLVISGSRSIPVGPSTKPVTCWSGIRIACRRTLAGSLPNGNIRQST